MAKRDSPGQGGCGDDGAVDAALVVDAEGRTP